MKLWGGRFKKATNNLMDDFHSSIGFDYVLYKQDIQGSIAHATMLGEQKIIPLEDAHLIVQTLKEILSDIDAGKIEFSVSAEDIHMNIETILIERIGDTGKRLHTGRSRNDQVALDIRMYMKDALKQVTAQLVSLCDVLLKTAKENLDTIMPGYTHLQKAQPITLAHHTMAYFQMFLRDLDRLNDCYRRTDLCPLGAGALAGTTYPLNRERVAELLNFSGITQNSLDSVSDRDFAIEAASAFSMIMMHLSRYCEELILWSSNEFGFAEMDDAFSTGSSIMPQKKNPDVCELIRGKTGRVYGDLTALLTVMKSLPLAYNKDMQEDKEAIFDAFHTTSHCLEIFTAMYAGIVFRKETMRKGSALGFTNATDAADYMVKKGLPFREAHEIIGKMVLYCIDNQIALDELSLEKLKQFHPVFDENFYQAIALETCVSQRTVPGGPAKQAVENAIRTGEAALQKFR